MKYRLDGSEYNVVIVRKNNKNTYMRVKDNMTIYITTSYLTTKKAIFKMLDDNQLSLRKMLKRNELKMEKENSFFYLGDEYDIIIVPTVDNIDIDFEYKKIYVCDQKMLDKWYKKEINDIFLVQFEKAFKMFEEVKIQPILKIRSMKTRWGVYNRKNYSVTLNSHLIEYELEKLNYVIFHELSHIVHFNHSASFWQLVSKYCPDYKRIRKELK